MSSIFRWHQSGRENTSQSGVVAAAVALIAVVLLTIGLSQGAQVAEELFISDQEAESTRVFNAAESGVEEALSKGEFGEQPEEFSDLQVADQIDTDVSIEPQGQLTTRVPQGDSVAIKVAGSEQLTVRWADSINCDAAALLFSIYSQDATGDVTVRYTSASPPCDSRVGDGFHSFNAAEDTGDYRYRFNLNTLDDDVLVLIKPLYLDTNLSVSGGQNLTHLIRSVAESQTAEGEDTQQQIIQALRTQPRAPRFLEYALYSPGGAIQQQ